MNLPKLTHSQLTGFVACLKYMVPWGYVTAAKYAAANVLITFSAAPFDFFVYMWIKHPN